VALGKDNKLLFCKWTFLEQTLNSMQSRLRTDPYLSIKLLHLFENKIARLFLDTPGAKFPSNPKSATIIAIAFLVVILEGE
jgi:hypothetical protein